MLFSSEIKPTGSVGKPLWQCYFKWWSLWMLEEGWPGGRQLPGGYCSCSLIKDLCQHHLVGRRMFLRVTPLLSRKNMRNVSSMREPSLSERKGVFLGINEILKITDMDKSNSHWVVRKLLVYSLLEYEWPLCMVCEHIRSQQDTWAYRDFLISCYVACISLSAKRILNDMDSSSWN